VTVSKWPSVTRQQNNLMIPPKNWRNIFIVKENCFSFANVEKNVTLLFYVESQDTYVMSLTYNILLQGNMAKRAIEMYNKAGMWEEAHQLAQRYMGHEEVRARCRQTFPFLRPLLFHVRKRASFWRLCVSPLAGSVDLGCLVRACDWAAE